MQQTATGVLQSIETRQAGWHRFNLAVPGRQYPLKLDTKLPDLINQGSVLVGQPVQVVYDESESQNINPNTGRPYTERRLQQIVPMGSFTNVPSSVSVPQPTGSYPGGYVPPPASSPPLAPPSRGGRDSEEMVRRVTWLSSVSTAATLMQGLLGPQANAETVKGLGPLLFTVADAIYHRARQVETGMIDRAQQQIQDAGWGQGEQPPPGDDDIPF